MDYGSGAGLLVILVLAVVFALTVILVPIIVFVVEAAVVLLAVSVVLRPWEVEAKTAGPPAEHRLWRVRGWKGSKQAVEEVARELSLGLPAAPHGAEL